MKILEKITRALLHKQYVKLTKDMILQMAMNITDPDSLDNPYCVIPKQGTTEYKELESIFESCFGVPMQAVLDEVDTIATGMQDNYTVEVSVKEQLESYIDEMIRILQDDFTTLSS